MKKSLIVLAATLVLSLAIVPTFAKRYSHAPVVKPTGYDYELVTPDGSVTPDGLSSSEDDPKLQAHGHERLFVKRSGKMYEITDMSTVAAVRAVLVPLVKKVDCKTQLVMEHAMLLAKQDRLTKQQSAIIRQQARLSRTSSNEAANQALADELSTKMDELETQIQELNLQIDAVNIKKEGVGPCEPDANQVAIKMRADEKVRDAISSTIAKGHVKQVQKSNSTVAEVSPSDGNCLAFDPLP